MTQPMEGELVQVMTVSSAASMLGVTTQTVLNLQFRHLLEGGWMLNRRYVTRESVEAYLKQLSEDTHHAEEKVSA